MFLSLRICGYRGLDEFTLDRLGRINLLVGTNNCGKTSILECIDILSSAEKRVFLYSSFLGRRGEWSDYGTSANRSSLDVRHLFANRDLDGEITVEATSLADAESPSSRSSVSICVRQSDGNGSQLELPDLDEDDESFELVIRWTNPDAEVKLKMHADGDVSTVRRPAWRREEDVHNVQFIRTDGINAPDTVRLFDKIVLTEREKDVTEALRIIEPAIERIASVGSRGSSIAGAGPGGIFLKMSGIEQRVPIGSAGDGMWRILGLALALANARGGILLVDEIDTGLHYSVMKDMWRMVGERAAALDTQVFATTHSRDCYESLAAIAAPESGGATVTIQRIDRSRSRAIQFSNDEIVAAAERGIEVR